MTDVRFYRNSAGFTGFNVSGHAGYREAGKDIVCAAVSSAVELAVNSMTDGMNIPADVSVDNQNAAVTFRIRSGLSDEQMRFSDAVMSCLFAQLEALGKDYKGKISVTVLKASE
jgi:uncharacterized protein YsxB (DUF464 family)